MSSSQRIGHYRCTHDGTLMGIPATGRQVDMCVMHIDRVSAGRIVEHRDIGDINAMWAQIGVEPPVGS
ncbi:MAG: ester cyclase [Ilumatobacteraceae bacterium]